MRVIRTVQTGPNSYDRTYILEPHNGCDGCDDAIALRFHKGLWTVHGALVDVANPSDPREAAVRVMRLWTHQMMAVEDELLLADAGADFVDAVHDEQADAALNFTLILDEVRDDEADQIAIDRAYEEHWRATARVPDDDRADAEALWLEDEIDLWTDWAEWSVRYETGSETEAEIAEETIEYVQELIPDLADSVAEVAHEVHTRTR